VWRNILVNSIAWVEKMITFASPIGRKGVKRLKRGVKYEPDYVSL